MPDADANQHAGLTARRAEESAIPAAGHGGAGIELPARAIVSAAAIAVRDETLVDAPLRTMASAAKPVAIAPLVLPPPLADLQLWVEGERTHLELLRLHDALDRVSAVEIKARIARYDEWFQKQVGQGTSQGNSFRQLLTQPPGPARKQELLAFGRASDPLAALRAALPAMLREKALGKLRRSAFDYVEVDRRLDGFEHFQLTQRAEELGRSLGAVLTPEDVIAAVRHWEPKLGPLQIEGVLDPRQLGQRLPCISKFFGGARPRSIAELHEVLAQDAPSSFANVLPAFQYAHVQNWLQQIADNLTSGDASLAMVHAQLASAEDVSREPTALSVWRFLYATGYRALHLEGDKRAADLRELAAVLTRPAELVAPIGAGVLPLWCQLVLQDEVLASFARLRDRRPEDAAQAFAWALGDDRLPVGAGLPVRSPLDLARFAEASRQSFEIVVDAVAGFSVADWLRGLAYRLSLGSPEHAGELSEIARRVEAAHGDRSRARAVTYRLISELGEGRLPLFSGTRVRLVTSDEELAEAVAADPSCVAEAVANGGFAEWLIGKGRYSAENATALHSWYSAQQPTQERAAQYALRIVGDRALRLGGHVVTSLAGLCTAYEAAPTDVAAAHREGFLLDWMNALAMHDQPLDPALLALAAQPDMHSLSRLLWRLGDTKLPLGSGFVSTVDALRAAADDDPHPVVEAVLDGRVVDFLRMRGEPALAEAVEALRPSLATAFVDPPHAEDRALAPWGSRIAEALGAPPGTLRVDRPSVDLGPIERGRGKRCVVELQNGGTRGVARFSVEVQEAPHVTVRTAPASGAELSLRPGTMPLQIDVALSETAPPGRYRSLVKLHPTHGEDVVIQLALRRGLPTGRMVLEVLAHVVALAVLLTGTRLLLGLWAESWLTTPSGRSLEPLRPGAFWPAGLVFAAATLLRSRQRNRGRMRSLVQAGLGYGAGVLVATALFFVAWLFDAVALKVLYGVLTVLHRTPVLSVSRQAAVGWALLGALLGLATGSQQTMLRNHSVRAGILTGAAITLIVLTGIYAL